MELLGQLLLILARFTQTNCACASPLGSESITHAVRLSEQNDPRVAMARTATTSHNAAA